MRWMLLLGIALCACAAPQQDPGPVSHMPRRDTSGLKPLLVGHHEVFVVIAADAASRARGMAGRERLPADEGMLFVYPDAAPRSFWMLDCRIDLDIAFLDEQRRILNVVTLPAPPPGTPSEQLPLAQSARPARFVLELPAGTFARWGLGTGAICTWKDGMRP